MLISVTMQKNLGGLTMSPLDPKVYEALLEEDKRKRLPTIEEEDVSYVDSLLTTGVDS